MSELVKQLSGCNVSSTGAKPTAEYDGENKSSGRLFGSEKELAAAWKLFAETKFAATAREEFRGDLPDIGSAESRSADVPSDADPKMCMSALADAKMHGLDGISIEAYKASPTAKNFLFDLVKRCWVEEDVPAYLVIGEFVMIYKNKGSKDDMIKYRFLCMLYHAYKMLSSYLLLRMLKDIEGFLPEIQAGF